MRRCRVRVSLSVPRLAVSCPSCEASRSGPPCCHKGLRAHSHVSSALSRLLRHAVEALRRPRPQTERCKVGCGVSLCGTTLYLHVIRMVTVLQHFLSVLTCSQAYVMASQSLQKHNIQHAAVRLR